MKYNSPIRCILAALGIGSLAQYALALGFLLPGLLVYGIAIWVFVSQVAGYLDLENVDEEQNFEGELRNEETSEMVNSFAILINNWRRMTISEILSGSYKTKTYYLPQKEKRERINRFTVIKNNWRQMTISEIYLAIFKSQNSLGGIQRTGPKDE